ncbi:UNVERIFIED_ORG: hypothetical protein LHK14_13000 [Roseateles sp. XES5]|nr:hypothetical protein [Roseateles sp. XES5]
MSADASPDETEAGGSERTTIEYSITMRVNGVSQVEIDAFTAGIEGWTVKPGADHIFLYPREEDGSGNVSAYLHGVLARHGKVFAAAAQIGRAREISLAIYFDADRIAAICPDFDAAIIRQLADLNFSLEICVFPSSFEDDEGTEE